MYICSTYKREKQPFQQKPKFSLIILNKMFNAFLCNFPALQKSSLMPPQWGGREDKGKQNRRPMAAPTVKEKTAP